MTLEVYYRYALDKEPPGDVFELTATPRRGADAVLPAVKAKGPSSGDADLGSGEKPKKKPGGKRKKLAKPLPSTFGKPSGGGDLPSELFPRRKPSDADKPY